MTRLHPFTLRFRDAATERAYCDEEFPRTVSDGRFAAFIGISSYLALGIFDSWVFAPEVQPTIWVIRLLTIAGAIATISLSFFPVFRRANYFLLSLIGVYAGIGFITFSFYLPPELAGFYYPGMILVCFFTYNFSGTRFVYALAIDMLLLLSYNVASVVHGDIPLGMLGVHDIFIVVANVIGGSAGYLNELQRRKLFLVGLNLRTEKENAEAARHEAELANVEKSRFLAAVSHDLRQPVHAQGMFLNVLAGTALDANQREIVAHLRATAAASSEMLHTLMDFSRIEAGAVKPKVQPFLLQPLLNKIEREFVLQADAKHLSYRSRETRLAATSDPALVEVILRNLVSNALRYTHHGGIFVGCRRRGDSVVLEVYDTGIGIEAAQHGEIFREFYQLGNPERDQRKGLGLGLSIVKGLAHALGHTVSLHSVPGRGSVFRLALPLAQAGDVTVEVTQQQPVPHQSGIPILLVDDDEAVRIGTKQQLLEWGFECETAETLEGALAAAKQRPPALVICDYRLRDHLTGAKVIAALREAVHPRLPALLITGDTAPERIKQALDSGITLLHKPLAPKELYRSIVEELESAEDGSGGPAISDTTRARDSEPTN